MAVQDLSVKYVVSPIVPIRGHSSAGRAPVSHIGDASSILAGSTKLMTIIIKDDCLDNIRTWAGMYRSGDAHLQ